MLCVFRISRYFIKSSISFLKSLTILRFLHYFWGFHPQILWILYFYLAGVFPLVLISSFIGMFVFSIPTFKCMVAFWLCAIILQFRILLCFQLLPLHHWFFVKLCTYSPACQIPSLLLGGFTREWTVITLLGWLCTWHYVGTTGDENYFTNIFCHIPFPGDSGDFWNVHFIASAFFIVFICVCHQSLTNFIFQTRPIWHNPCTNCSCLFVLPACHWSVHIFLSVSLLMVPSYCCFLCLFICLFFYCFNVSMYFLFIIVFLFPIHMYIYCFVTIFFICLCYLFLFVYSYFGYFVIFVNPKISKLFGRWVCVVEF